MENNRINGSEALLKCLVDEGADTIFGYPGGQIMPVYDKLVDYSDKLRHILVRHEQGAIHAAQGYARATGKTGVVLVTSGPGATNVITGIMDAKVDSTPIVVIAGQVSNSALGTDAFQEADLIGMTGTITKWNYQVRDAKDMAWAVSRAFYIARNGRPGPVVLDVTKDAQLSMVDFEFKKCGFIRSYNPYPKPSEEAIAKAAMLLNEAERPFVVFGQGITLSGAEKELKEFLHKGDIPAGSTLLGLSALPTDDPLFAGMIGMHGYIAPNIKTNECDVLVAVGMRFDDRVTGTVQSYARQAKIIHIDIDPCEVGKIIPVDVSIIGDAKAVLRELTAKIARHDHKEWITSFENCLEVEKEKVIYPEVHPKEGWIKMGEVVDAVAEATKGNAVVVTDVGQNQMIAARYSKFTGGRSFISSGGLGTMGFGLPAAIGAKIGAAEKTVCLFVGDGGIQMTIEELGTIMQEKTGVKIFILNNNWLGNVRQWQELFFNKRYSQTRMQNPDYGAIASAYGIRCAIVEKREDLAGAVEEMLSDDAPAILDIHVEEEDNVMPMVAPGKPITNIMLNGKEIYEYGK
ncbi:MAG: biosynthetic-type acetolactate synthase large subunit [Bacteroidales bacterium]|jgi:acetolactate synthase-1/2/3 large subunit|nr:biosynthetic-type acetolactate synthase large subunit [Bacteroidales bacterium]MCI2136259.1 biosynthetic-type acetolactate synthase large subunit [Bacteroidales bacterium]